ncbi:MAG: hypothetical protein CME62_10095 [Halobacteriovoraceae bacterium]|nr:hypothetical protein [Halobacteriovoraceae bacterium]|tara:strand:+ start:12250 stop:12861 length:612 start_codon:yes stop_codon:yes gene_type:complete
MNDTTKKKILEVAHKLFADKGFQAVSIRELAKACDVNIAAINYHFENKAKLYQETIKHSVADMTRDIKEIYEAQSSCSIEDLSIKVYNLFIAKSENLRSSFRLILTVSENHEAFGDSLIEHHGPPGGEYFYECLKQELPGVEQADLDWAVRSIFTQIIHKSLIKCNSTICKSLEEIGITHSVIEEDIRRLIRVIRRELSEPVK